MPTSRIAFATLSVFLIVAAQGATTIRLTCVEYEDRVRAVWTAQIIAVLLAWPHEHQVASSVWLENFPKPYKAAPVDDDWYYEKCAPSAPLKDTALGSPCSNSASNGWRTVAVRGAQANRRG